MHEYYREYLEHNNLRFLIIAFKEHTDHVLKIYLHRTLIHQFPFHAADDNKSIMYDRPATFFEKYIEKGKDWVRKNY